MAEACGDTEEILALDRSARRLDKVVANCRRLGLSRVRSEVGDLLVRRPEPMGGVLLDAPCSSLSVLAANPDARWRKTEADIAEQAALQRRLLEAASAWVRPGGRLVYAVCTFSREESSEQRAWFLDRHPEFRLEAAAPGELPERCLGPEGELRVWPGSEGSAGIYALRFRRESK
jgi:16S rRNA (cytosine967-C5)-methyltransferase